MSEIKIVHEPTEEQLLAAGVRAWPIWTKEESEFPWHYDSEETCYLLAGEVEVIPQGGQPVLVRAGDLVTFPKGLTCTWKVRQAVRKHYRFAAE